MKNDFSLEIRLEYERRKAVETYKNSLYFTIRDLLGYDKVLKETHQDLIANLEANTLRKLIVEPRGSFKSTICSVAYPIWLLINNPNHRILLDSEIFGNSKTFLREIKAHLESPKLTHLFGGFRTNKWNESEILIYQREDRFKEASVTCGGVGTTKVGQHYSVIIGDDYNSPANTSNRDQREKVIRHYQYNISILDPDGIYAVIGTRYHEGDLIGWILKNEIGIKHFTDADSLQYYHNKDGVYYVE